MGKIIQFQQVAEKKREQVGVEYECYVTLERLMGYCNLLICEKGQQKADWFFLSFTPEGLLRHTKLHTAQKIRQWLDGRTHIRISYLQAIRLLGDAVRQNYKYEKGRETEWINEDASVHLQRIWQEDFYNDVPNSMDWLLPKQECAAMLNTYFRALGNKDAVLLYDLSAERIRDAERRSMYAYRWNHVLEDMHIVDFEVDRMSTNRNGEEDYTIFLTVYGAYQGGQMMEVDLSLRIIREQGDFRILQEQVLEPRLIYKRQYC